MDLAADRLQMNWKNVVELDSRYLRPTEVDFLLGDASKAKKFLGWYPEVTIEEGMKKFLN